MHRLPAATTLVAAALVAATGCVAVSPQTTGHGRPHSVSRPAGPIGPGHAREALTDIGPDASGGPPGDPSRDPTSHAPPGTAADGSDPKAPRNPADPRSPRDPVDPAPADPADPREPTDRAHPSDSVRSPSKNSSNSSPPSRDSRPPETSEHPPEPPSRPAPPPREDSPLPQRPPQAPPSSGRAADPRPAPPRSSGGGVCSLGHTYGHWEQGSDASRICGQVYGH
ncbi:hypothetical protein ACPCTO_14775 [Streptomyces olivoreticuli]